MSKNSYTPKKGFSWALFYTAITFILIFYGTPKKNIFALTLSLISGAIGLYFTKKSWVSYKPTKRKNSTKKK